MHLGMVTGLLPSRLLQVKSKEGIVMDREQFVTSFCKTSRQKGTHAGAVDKNLQTLLICI